MRKFKAILGIGLIALALTGLVYWEVDGRERLLTDIILVANQDISADRILTEAMISKIGIAHDSKINGALGPESLAILTGQRTKQFIPQNGQLSTKYFYTDEFYLKKGDSIYVIKPDWISMISSAARQGDTVGIYSDDGLIKIGSFKVAFVKDAAVREVKDVAAKDTEFPGQMTQPDNKDELLARTDATSVATHIEIIATLKDYQRILQMVGGADPKRIMLIQE